MPASLPVPEPSTPRQTAALRSIARVRQRLLALDLVCAGTISRRLRTCGKPNCRCASDPGARHGPYFEWTRLEDGRFRHTYLTPAEARRYAHAIANLRTARRLLKQWQRASRRLMDDPE